MSEPGLSVPRPYPPVATSGEGGGFGILVFQRSCEDGGKQCVDDVGACMGGFDSACAIAVICKDVSLFDFQEAFVELDAFGWGKLTIDGRLE